MTDKPFSTKTTFMSQLKELQIGGNSNITDETITTIFNNYRSIKSLNVRSCRKITQTPFTTESAFVSQITELNIGSNKNITNESLKVIIKACPQLKKLHLNECALTTIPNTIRTDLPLLEGLYIRGNKITNLPDTFPPLLKELNVYNNELSALPQILKHNEYFLEELDIGVNKSN